MLGHSLTGAPDLLCHADGVPLTARVDGGSYRLRLPAGCARLTLLSRHWVPAETRADESDTRRLGVAVAGLRLEVRPVALNDARLTKGWAAPEPEWRWTTGEGVIEVAGVTEVSFELVLGGTYWLEPPIAAQAAAG